MTTKRTNELEDYGEAPVILGLGELRQEIVGLRQLWAREILSQRKKNTCLYRVCTVNVSQGELRGNSLRQELAERAIG